MSVITRIITQDWYTGASLYYTVYASDGSTLQARTAMSESPAGSGCFYHANAAWDTSWAGRVVYDDGSIYVSEEIAPPSNVTKCATDTIDANALKADAVAEIQSGLATSAAVADIALTQPTVTTCHTAGGTQTAPTLTNDLLFPVPTGLGLGWKAIYFGETKNVLSYNAGTMTVTVDSAFSTPVEGGHDIEFYQAAGVIVRPISVVQRSISVRD